MSTRSAFTLLETLIAAFIVVLVTGASITANRVIHNNAALVADHSQMNSLADEALANVRMLRDGIESGSAAQDFGSTIGLAKDQGANDQLSLYFYAKPDAIAGEAFVEWNGSTLLYWCTGKGGGNNCPASLYSPVGPGERNIGNCKMGASNCKLNELISVLGGDLIAVRRSPYLSNYQSETCAAIDQNENRAVADVTNPLNRQPSTNTCIFTNQNDKWDFYIRKITVMRTGNQTAEGVLANHFYTVTASIQKYSNPSYIVSKSMILTDTAPALTNTP